MISLCLLLCLCVSNVHFGLPFVSELSGVFDYLVVPQERQFQADMYIQSERDFGRGPMCAKKHKVATEPCEAEWTMSDLEIKIS
jgi:hypothetical protein